MTSSSSRSDADAVTQQALAGDRAGFTVDAPRASQELSIEMGDVDPVPELQTLCQWVEISCRDIENALGSSPLTIAAMKLRHAAQECAKELPQ